MMSKLIPQLLQTYRRALSTHHVAAVLTPLSPMHTRNGAHGFSTTNNPPLRVKFNLPPRPKPPPEDEIKESFLKGSGPGGQKINKTSSAVQLIHKPTGVVVKCQATRSRSQNRAIARYLLASKLDNMTNGDESRSAIVGEVKRKKTASSAKKSRRKYRKLEEEKKGGAATGEAEGYEDEYSDGDYFDETSLGSGGGSGLNRGGDGDVVDRETRRK
ncbi:RF-1 domain-containing protein [Xylaria sp. CBS 124048]|nr:RF-1 domain-containing protein [Xylaria sp. CBS 124048]